jgi:hypothetical protein
MRISRVLASLSAVAVALSLYACDSGDGGGGGSIGSLVDAQCSAYHSCCVASGQDSSKEACVGFYNAFGATKAAAGPNAAECEALLRERTADGTFCTLGSRKDGVDICDGAFGDKKDTTSGKTAPGAACKSDSECAVVTPGATAECYYRSSFTNGSSSTTQTCAERVVRAAGEACTSTLTFDGATLSFSSGSTDGPPPTQIGICRNADGLYCGRTNKVCAPLVALGETCEGSESCADATNDCTFASGGTGSVCTAKRKIGEACSSFDRCEKGAGCKGDVCVALAPNGTACASSSECAGGSCNNQKCEGSLSSGGATICFTDK